MPPLRPLIGIPCSSFPDAWFPPAIGINRSYLRAVEAAGGLPTLIHLTDDEAVLEAHYGRVDGLLLAGGEDVDPSCYGAAPHPLLGEVNRQRDAAELALTRWAVRDGKPLLGICRGLQLLNVALGGTLVQDIPSELPGTLNHRESEDAQNMALLAHPIALEPDSWLAEHLGAQELIVNTLHHQAARDIPAGLRVVARAPDGVVEALEGRGPGFVVAVQCHPEDLWEQADIRWARVFAGFVRRCQCPAG